MSCLTGTARKGRTKGASLVGSRSVTGAARERSDPLNCDWGIGAWEMEQQDVSDAATS